VRLAEEREEAPGEEEKMIPRCGATSSAFLRRPIVVVVVAPRRAPTAPR
jgi:hypothetical protein